MHIKQGKGICYAIVQQEKVEVIIEQKSKQSIQNEGFEIHTPLEHNAMRTVVVKNIDQFITDFTDQEVIDRIQLSNPWAKVESIYRLAQSGRLFNVRFATTEMADKALRDGLIVLHQKINSSYIEKETFIKLTPCYNCFAYDHKTKECSKPKQTLCSFCASKEHFHNNCPASSPKCLNCGRKHKTLASACPIRRDLIKNRAKDVRERSRSRSKSRYVSYASTVNNSSQQQSIRNVNVSSQETKELVSKIITSIVFAHYMEHRSPVVSKAMLMKWSS